MTRRPKPKLGRPLRSDEPANDRFTLRLTKTERRRWTQSAAGLALGDWIRDRCNEYVERERYGNHVCPIGKQ